MLASSCLRLRISFWWSSVRSFSCSSKRSHLKTHVKKTHVSSWAIISLNLEEGEKTHTHASISRNRPWGIWPHGTWLNWWLVLIRLGCAYSSPHSTGQPQGELPEWDWPMAWTQWEEGDLNSCLFGAQTNGLNNHDSYDCFFSEIMIYKNLWSFNTLQLPFFKQIVGTFQLLETTLSWKMLGKGKFYKGFSLKCLYVRAP